MLDVSIQAQIINLCADLREQEETSFLFISHVLSVVENLCDRILIMYRGVVVEEGTKDHIFTDLRHPYTQTLLDAAPFPDPRRSPSQQSVGTVTKMCPTMWRQRTSTPRACV